MLDWLLDRQAKSNAELPSDGTVQPAPSAKVAGATSLDPTIAALAEKNEYLSDLMTLLSQYPELEQANTAIAQKTQEAAALIDTDRQLQVLVKLDEEARKAKVNIHKTLSQHYATIAKHSVELNAANNAYVLNMAGHSGQIQQQNAELSGILQARQAIANRVRGAA